MSIIPIRHSKKPFPIEKMSFTSKYLGILKKKGVIGDLTDGNLAISTINIDDYLSAKKIASELSQYSEPTIMWDRFSKSEEVEPIIETVEFRIGKINEIGFEIVSIVVGNERWMSGQKVEYKLIKKTLLNDSYNIIHTVPGKHKVEIDIANKKVRIVGPNVRNGRTGVKGVGEWHSF